MRSGCCAALGIYAAYGSGFHEGMPGLSLELNRKQRYFVALCFLWLGIRSTTATTAAATTAAARHITRVSTRIPFTRENFQDILRSVHTGSYTASSYCRLENATNLKDTTLHGEQYHSICFDYCTERQQCGQVQVFTNRRDESRMIFVTAAADVVAMLKLRVRDEPSDSFVYIDAHVLQDDQGLALVNALLNGARANQVASEVAAAEAVGGLRSLYYEKVSRLPINLRLASSSPPTDTFA